MKIEQYYHHESGFRFEISIQSKDTITHATMTDLREDQRNLVKQKLNEVGIILDKLLVSVKDRKCQTG